MLPNRTLNKAISLFSNSCPTRDNQRYDIDIRTSVSASEMAKARKGTVQNEGRGQDPYLIHTVNGTEYRTKLSTLRGDYRSPEGVVGNKLAHVG